MRLTDCLHCREPAGVNVRRGLCRRCYTTAAIRRKYPRDESRAPGREPTEEELDAMIAEQRANLPPWWDAETRRMNGGDDTAKDE